MLLKTFFIYLLIFSSIHLYASGLFKELHKAVEDNDVSSLQSYVFKGFDPNERDENEMLPLDVAVILENIESIQKLLNLGADPYITDQNGISIFDKVYRSNNLIIMNIFMDKFERDLKKAIETGDQRTAQYLLEVQAKFKLREKTHTCPRVFFRNF